MRNHEIETWALRVIDRVTSGQPVEDDHVELKAKWVEPTKAARRIAGHANASHGQPAMWLIGVDENARTVPGVDATEFSEWHSQIVACFDELAPATRLLNVPYNGVTVAALLLETDRAPYVVKNPNGGGAIAREVPYRHGTRCDSATRGQLLRILASPMNAPKLEPLWIDATTWIPEKKEDGKPWTLAIRLQCCYFVTQPQDQQSVFTEHGARITANVNGIQLNRLEFITFEIPGPYTQDNKDFASVVGPSYLNIVAKVREATASEPFYPAGPLAVGFSFDVPNCDAPATSFVNLARREVSPPNTRTWRYTRESTSNAPAALETSRPGNDER